MSHYVVPQHCIVGEHVLEEAKECLEKLGTKALVVTGQHVGHSSIMEEVKKLLRECSMEYVIFDNITGEPTDCMIEEGVIQYKKTACDFVIGVGGGSPLDAAKAIAVMTVSEGEITQYAGKNIVKTCPPIVAIPTTAGTGSEATKFTIITDSKNGIKLLLKGDSIIPTLAIVDSTFTRSTPPHVTVGTGIDALTHAIEAYTSKKAIAMTDTLAISAVKRIMKYLPIAYEDGSNREARNEMSLAALEAGICINNSSVTLVHGMSRPIGAVFHVPHGISNAMLLPECLTFAVDGAYERFATLAREIKVATEEVSEKEAANRFIQAVEQLCIQCKVPTLQQYGIDKESYEKYILKMAKDAMDSGSPANTRKEVTVDDCIELYHRIY